MNIKLAERELKTKFGTFREILYYDGQKESIAIVMGDVAGKENVLCRVHSHCTGAHIFNSVECECREEMERSQFLIEKVESGIVIWLDQEAKGNGHLALIESTKYKKQGDTQALAYQKAGFAADARSYRPAAEILADLNVKSIVLLANNPSKADDLRKASIIVSDTKQMTIDEESLKAFQAKLRSGLSINRTS
jgi:GTP cyclohydrolase II